MSSWYIQILSLYFHAVGIFVHLLFDPWMFCFLGCWINPIVQLFMKISGNETHNQVHHVKWNVLLPC